MITLGGFYNMCKNVHSQKKIIVVKITKKFQLENFYEKRDVLFTI